MSPNRILLAAVLGGLVALAGCSSQWPLADAAPGPPDLYDWEEPVEEAEVTEPSRTELPPPSPAPGPLVACEIEIIRPEDGQVITGSSTPIEVYAGDLPWVAWCSWGVSDETFACVLEETPGAYISGDFYPAFEGPRTWEYWGSNGIEACHDRVTFFVDWS